MQGRTFVSQINSFAAIRVKGWIEGGHDLHFSEWKSIYMNDVNNNFFANFFIEFILFLKQAVTLFQRGSDIALPL